MARTILPARFCLSPSTQLGGLVLPACRRGADGGSGAGRLLGG
ncbi:hypothetical protein ACP4OV_012055 [Aristida adscensionis]